MLKFAVKKTSKDIFHDAVASKDTSRLKFLLENNQLGFQVDELDEDGLTALQRSCFIGNLKLVQLLVMHGANLHIQDREGWSVLHASAVAGNYSILRYLVCMGADVTVTNDFGQLPIDLASNLNCVIILLEAMEKIGRHDLIEKYFTERPTHKVTIENQLRLLANRDASLSLIDGSSESTQNNGEEDNQLSIVLNSDVSQEQLESTSSSTDSLGDLWSTSNKENPVRFNEEGGQPEDSRIQIDKRTSKRAVCKKCHGKKRLSSVSSSSSDSSTSSYDSAYTSINSEGNTNGIEVINSNDESTTTEVAEQTIRSPNHKIHHCKKKDKHLHKPRRLTAPDRLTTTKQNKLLLDQIKEHEDVNALNSSGLSLLHVTASQGDSKTVKILLEKGAEVNRQALNGSSPLHEAARGGHVDCTLLLLNYGADAFADDDNGLLPIDIAEDGRLKCLLNRAMTMK